MSSSPVRVVKEEIEALMVFVLLEKTGSTENRIEEGEMKVEFNHACCIFDPTFKSMCKQRLCACLFCLRSVFPPFFRDQNRGKTTTAAQNRLALTITSTNYSCLT